MQKMDLSSGLIQTFTEKVILWVENGNSISKAAEKRLLAES